jgi:hypothetical protein
MFSKTKHFLLIFLALLQFVAPLVHAHTGEGSQIFSEPGSAKLHIPGLESYDVANERLIFVSASHQYTTSGIIIGVDAGIKQNQANLISNSDNSFVLPRPSVVTERLISVFDSNFSPQVPILVSRYLFSSHTPRAPPAQ